MGGGVSQIFLIFNFQIIVKILVFIILILNFVVEINNFLLLYDYLKKVYLRYVLKDELFSHFGNPE